MIIILVPKSHQAEPGSPLSPAGPAAAGAGAVKEEVPTKGLLKNDKRVLRAKPRGQ